jgi:hypothetical protein
MALRRTLILRRREAPSRRTRFRHPALATAALPLLLCVQAAAQQPTPLFNTPPANPAPAGTTQAVPPSDQPAQASPAQPAPVGRDFCEQTVTAQPADPASVPERYRPFVGIFSDAAWNPQLCAALVVEAITGDGTTTITYVFGPIGAGKKAAGGVLHGTGVIKDGSLLFQNSDGSQYAFQPFYSDLAGRWTTPKGQTYEAIFKRAF